MSNERDEEDLQDGESASGVSNVAGVVDVEGNGDAGADSPPPPNGPHGSNADDGDDGDDGNDGSEGDDLPPWKNPAYRFVALFLVYLALVAWGYPEFRERNIEVVDALAVFTAQAEYHLFSLFTDRISQAEKVVSYYGFAVHIIEECTGVYEVLIFAAAVLAFPTTIAKKGVGLGLGIPLLYLFNVLRIGVLLLVGKYWPEYFDFMHLYFWQATLILMITSVWLLWITQVVNRDWSRSPSSA